MPFSRSELLSRRPILYHLTARENLPLLRETRTLFPASTIFAEGGAEEWLAKRRAGHVRVTFRGREVLVRDQGPLHARHVELTDGWAFEQFVRHLNDRVFFWPADVKGNPIRYGRNHIGRYMNAGELPVILRVETKALLDTHTPLFCKSNSGAPRCNPRSGKARRGPETFLPADDTSYAAVEVSEVTFAGPVTLPASTYVGDAITGPWQLL